MVKCEDWEEFYWFLKTFGNFTCLNCKYNHNKEPTQFFFCTNWMCMVDLNHQFLCREWESDDGESLPKHSRMWSLSSEYLDGLENGELTISDLRGMYEQEVIE